MASVVLSNLKLIKKQGRLSDGREAFNYYVSWGMWECIETQIYVGSCQGVYTRNNMGVFIVESP